MSTAAAESSHIIAQLKAVIARQGLTAYAVALRAGVSPRVVQRWMAGERDIRLETADRLAQVLGVRLVEVAPRRAARARVELPAIVAGESTIGTATPAEVAH